MNLDRNYIIVMIDSLYKKERILESIITLNNYQKVIIQDLKNNLDKFDQTILEKQELIDELMGLDEGFQNLYSRVKEMLVNNSNDYKEDINKMKQLISEIMKKSIQIQTQEEENRAIIMQQTNHFRKGMKQFKDSKAAASKYYKNMQKLSYVTPQFLDKKK